MTAFDVIVVGAGPAGAATATTAARAGLGTVLVERSGAARSWAGESLPPGMDRPLRTVFGPAVLSEAHHARAMGTRSSWGSAALVETDYLRNPLGEGWLLDRARLDRDARQAAAAAGATIVRVRGRWSLTRDGAGWRLETDGGETLDAGFVVDATGRSARVLRSLGIGRTATDRQVAVIATVRDTGDAHAGTTIEAVRDGWWYTTPLPDGRRVIAFLTDADLWRADDRDWQARRAGTLHMARVAGPTAAAARPRAFPAETATADRIAGDGWLAVGDAAVSFDPLSSQGLATAVLMGARAGEALAARDRAGAIAAWTDAYAMLVAEHADLKRHYVRQEERWPDTPFWRRRRG
ncbi:MAG TPA: tryptophan 7-halogenase [Bauldia sp.]|nr:tryptophan 7-halogenase [Bauldia sp.]